MNGYWKMKKHLMESGKLIQSLGKPVYTNKRKIRENKPSSLLFLTYKD